MGAKTYSPKKVSVTIAGLIATGYAEGTFIQIERAADTFTKVVGSDGEVGRVHSADHSGKITLTLQQTSEFNDVLSALQQADELTLSGKFPIAVKDNNGTSLYVSGDAWIMKPANSEYSNTMSTREWVIEFADYETFFAGGNS